MAYNPNDDLVVDAVAECVLSGKTQQNALYGLLRSYNNGAPKAELSRHTPSQANMAMCRSIRFEMHEIPFAIKALEELYHKMQQRGAKSQQPVVVPIQQRPHPNMQQQQINNNQYAPQQPGYQAPPQGYQAPQNPYQQSPAPAPGQFQQPGFPPAGGFNPGGNQGGGTPPRQPF